MGPVPEDTVCEEPHWAMESSKVHYREEDGEIIFKTYIPPSRDAIHLPPHVLYLLMAVFIIMLVLYAIIGHLIKDLFHDFAGNVGSGVYSEIIVNPIFIRC